MWRKKVMAEENLRVITTRVPQKVIDYVNRVAEEESLDKAAIYRKLLLKAIAQDRVERAIAAYVRDELTLLNAAEMAGLPASIFAEELNKRNIRRGLGIEALREGVDTLNKYLGKKVHNKSPQTH